MQRNVPVPTYRQILVTQLLPQTFSGENFFRAIVKFPQGVQKLVACKAAQNTHKDSYAMSLLRNVSLPTSYLCKGHTYQIYSKLY